MKLIYMDESGNTGKRGDDSLQPLYLLAALVIDENKVSLIENDIRMLGLKYFGTDSTNYDFEFHGYEIHKGKGRYFSKLAVDKRIEIIDEFLNLIANYQIPIFYSVFKKMNYLNALISHPHSSVFFSLIQHIEQYLRNEQALGLLVADENPEVEKMLLNILEINKIHDLPLKINFGKETIRISRIIDSIHFVESHTNRLIQLADIISYVLSRGIRVKNLLEESYKNYYFNVISEITFMDWIEMFALPKQKIEIKHFQKLVSQDLVNVLLEVENVAAI